MIIQADTSLYPLQTLETKTIIEKFIDDMENSSLEVKVGSMGTQIIGELAEVFYVLSNAFAKTAVHYKAVLVVKVSNACPLNINPT